MHGPWELAVSKSEFSRVNRSLTRYFRKRVPWKEPQDLAATTWLRITQSYAGKCPLHPFAYIVARKQVFEIKHNRKRTLPTEPLCLDEGDEDFDPKIVPVATGGPSLDSLLMLAAGHDALRRALDQVANEYRDVVRLWLEGCDTLEIAETLAINYNTVRSRLHRGKRQTFAALELELGR